MMLTNVSSILTTSPSNWRRVDLWAFRSALCCGECIFSGASGSARILTAVVGKGKKQRVPVVSGERTARTAHDRLVHLLSDNSRERFFIEGFAALSEKRRQDENEDERTILTRASALFPAGTDTDTSYCSVEMKGPRALGDISRRKR